MDYLKFDINNIRVKNFFTILFLLTPIVIFFSKFLSDFFLSSVATYSLIYLINFKLFNHIKKLIFFFIIIIYFSLNLILNNFDIVLILKSFSLIRFPLFILFAFIAIGNIEFIKKKNIYILYPNLYIFNKFIYSSII